MRYFCSFSYTDGGEVFFGNTLMNVQVDPYDDIVEFRDKFNEAIGLPQVMLLYYKKVKS